jgi:ATP-dependent RNA helicase RhlB
MSIFSNLFKTKKSPAKPVKKSASAAKPAQKQPAQKQPAQKKLSSKQRPAPNPAEKQPLTKQPSGDGGKPRAKQPPTDLPLLGQDFIDLDLPEPLNLAIRKLNFSNCTPIQKEVLPHSLDGEDVIAQAQTGTGKTAAFLISIITYQLENPERQPRKPGTPFALIIAPTRELVMQIASDAELLTEFTDLHVMAVVGGIDYEKQKRELERPVEVIVATPGRLLDFCRSGVINLGQVEMLVIDEADRMLNMGFIPDVKAIVQRTPKKDKRQTQLYSATFSEDIKRLAKTWTLDPIRIEIEPEQVAVSSVEQLIYFTSESEKFMVLCNLVAQQTESKVIVFVNRRDETRRLEEKLYRQGFKTGLLTGEVAQRKRIKTLEEFKEGDIQVMVATDVAGRGIHVDNISHVVNYNLPEDPEDYVHRIGRTGRAGAKGISISLVCESDAFMMPSIEELLGESLSFTYPPDDLLIQLAPPVRARRVNNDLIPKDKDTRKAPRRRG